MTGLPMFYGRGLDTQYAVWDGDVGNAMNKKLEDKLGVVMIGRWFDLGFGQMFITDKEVKSHANLVGLKARAPRGVANLAPFLPIAPFKAFDATTVKIAGPYVPQAFQRNTVDGVINTHE